MLILVANLGSTSFKYKLFDLTRSKERVLATGSAERIGTSEPGKWTLDTDADEKTGKATFADHAAAIRHHLDKLVSLRVIGSPDMIEAVGFKAVHGGPIKGAVRVEDEVLDTMERFSPLAPAHNPPYIAAMKSLRELLPKAEQVAAFETSFHSTIPPARQVYGIPHEWIADHGIRRYGFHGASHRYVASRMKGLAPKCPKLINFHLGGSCSVCAMDAGHSVATSMGTTPQTGLFHSNRVGDFDPFAMLKLEQDGLSRDDIFDTLGKRSGLLGLSGVSGDMRDVEAAADEGNEQAQLAIDAFVESCRHYLGAYLVALEGADAITFTGGIGQHGDGIRRRILQGLKPFGIALDPEKNAAATGKVDERIDHESADLATAERVQVWIVPTDEEVVVARQTLSVLQNSN